MTYYSVESITNLLGLKSPETVRRWIREVDPQKNLAATKGLGRRGSTVSSEALLDFLERNPQYLTPEVQRMLDLESSEKLSDPNSIPDESKKALYGILGGFQDFSRFAFDTLAGKKKADGKAVKQIRNQIQETSDMLEKEALKLSQYILEKNLEIHKLEDEVRKAESELKMIDGYKSEFKRIESFAQAKETVDPED